jgi:hypothetical protein
LQGVREPPDDQDPADGNVECRGNAVGCEQCNRFKRFELRLVLRPRIIVIAFAITAMRYLCVYASLGAAQVLIHSQFASQGTTLIHVYHAYIIMLCIEYLYLHL